MMNEQEMKAIAEWEVYKGSKYDEFIKLVDAHDGDSFKTFERECVIYTVYMNAINQGRKFSEKG